jgi:hypothetical protein
VYRVRGAVVGGNFSPIGEYSSTVKIGENERRSSVASVLKGYFQNQLRITEGIVDTSHDANNERPPGEVFSLSLL